MCLGLVVSRQTGKNVIDWTRANPETKKFRLWAVDKLKDDARFNGATKDEQQVGRLVVSDPKGPFHGRSIHYSPIKIHVLLDAALP